MPARRHTAEFLLTAWVRAGRVVTGMDWTPLEVHFARPAPPDTREHARFFRAGVHFAMPDNALVLAAALLEAPCIRADAALVSGSPNGWRRAGRDRWTAGFAGRRTSF